MTYTITLEPCEIAHLAYRRMNADWLQEQLDRFEFLQGEYFTGTGTELHVCATYLEAAIYLNVVLQLKDVRGYIISDLYKDQDSFIEFNECWVITSRPIPENYQSEISSP